MMCLGMRILLAVVDLSLAKSITYPFRLWLCFMCNNVLFTAFSWYSRLSLSRNRRDPQKQFEISELRHIRFVVLGEKQFEQPIFTNDYVI